MNSAASKLNTPKAMNRTQLRRAILSLGGMRWAQRQLESRGTPKSIGIISGALSHKRPVKAGPTLNLLRELVLSCAPVHMNNHANTKTMTRPGSQGQMLPQPR